MKTGDLVTKNVDILAYFNIWNLFQIPLHQNFRFWNSLLQLFDDDFRREIEVLVVFVKPKVVSNFCLAVFLKPKVVSRNISALWVVFFFWKFHELKMAVFWPKFTISKVSKTPSRRRLFSLKTIIVRVDGWIDGRMIIWVLQFFSF